VAHRRGLHAVAMSVPRHQAYNVVTTRPGKVGSIRRPAARPRLTASPVVWVGPHWTQLINKNGCSYTLKKHETLGLALEVKAVIVLPTITHNYGHYLYDNYVGNALVGIVIT